ATAAPFHRPDLREATFPEAEDMLGDLKLISDFANGAERLCSLAQLRLHRLRLRAAGGRRSLGCLAADEALVNALFHNVARAEDQDPPRRNRYFIPGFGIAPHAFALLADAEGTERGKLHRIPPCQAR